MKDLIGYILTPFTQEYWNVHFIPALIFAIVIGLGTITLLAILIWGLIYF